jgi:osmoprotectant transport system permease protein
MNLTAFLRENWLQICVLWREHLVLVVCASLAAVGLGVPLGIAVAKRKAWRGPIFAFANVLQTVPSLALFGLLIPLPFIGGIGARTAIVALTLYALLPIIRNTATGILDVDPKVRESAVAMGMTDWQILRQVEIPLALNVILSGVRVAVVVAVGTATIAAAIGAGGLGTFIFRGLRQNDNRLLIAGAGLSALLALLADFSCGRLANLFREGKVREETSRSTDRWLAFAAVVLAFAPVLLSFNAADGTSNVAGRRKVVVGSKDFTESVILAEILAQSLEARGVPVERKFELGGNLAHDGLLAKQIDVYPEYTGTAFTAILKYPPMTDTDAVYEKVKANYAERFQLAVGPPLGFSNDFAILVRKKDADERKLKTISDAVPVSANWRAGFGQDFISRADGYEGFRKAYGFAFSKPPREMDLSLTYRALAAGEVDIIAGNSTDGLISALGLVQLTDDRHYFPPYQAVFIARRTATDDNEVLKTVIEELKLAISTDDMRRMNLQVDGEKKTPREVAAAFLQTRLKPAVSSQ